MKYLKLNFPKIPLKNDVLFLLLYMGFIGTCRGMGYSVRGSRSLNIFFYLFVSFPQKRNGIVFSSWVNYLHSGDNIQSELTS